MVPGQPLCLRPPAVKPARWSIRRARLRHLRGATDRRDAHTPQAQSCSPTPTPSAVPAPPRRSRSWSRTPMTPDAPVMAYRGAGGPASSAARRLIQTSALPSRHSRSGGGSVQSSIPFGLACRANPRLTPCHSTTPFHHKYFPLAHAGSLRLMQEIGRLLLTLTCTAGALWKIQPLTQSALCDIYLYSLSTSVSAPPALTVNHAIRTSRCGLASEVEVCQLCKADPGGPQYPMFRTRTWTVLRDKRSWDPQLGPAAETCNLRDDLQHRCR